MNYDQFFSPIAPTYTFKLRSEADVKFTHPSITNSYKDFHKLYNQYPKKSIIDFQRTNINMPQAGVLAGLDVALIEEKLEKCFVYPGLKRAVMSFGGGGMSGVLTDIAIRSIRFKVGDFLGYFLSPGFSNVRWEKISDQLYLCHCDLAFYTLVASDPMNSSNGQFLGAYLVEDSPHFYTQEFGKVCQMVSDNKFGTPSCNYSYSDVGSDFEIIEFPKRAILSASAQWSLQKTSYDRFRVNCEFVRIDAYHPDVYFKDLANQDLSVPFQPLMESDVFSGFNVFMNDVQIEKRVCKTYKP